MDVTERRRLAEELEARARSSATTDRRKDETRHARARAQNPLAPLSAALTLLRQPASDASRDSRRRPPDATARATGRRSPDASRITQQKDRARTDCQVSLADVAAGRAIESAKPAIEARGQVFRVDRLSRSGSTPIRPAPHIW